MPFSHNCNLLKEEIFIFEKNNLFIKRGKNPLFCWNWKIKSSGNSQKSKKELRKRRTFAGAVRRTLQKGTMAFWSHSRSFTKGHETTTQLQSQGLSLSHEHRMRQRRGCSSCFSGCPCWGVRSAELNPRRI